MQKLFRSNIWWVAVVPQVLGWVYFCILDGTFHFPEQLQSFGFFFLALVTTSAFGYLFNDLCDVEADKAAGKSNSLGKLSFGLRLVIVTLALAVAVISWYLVKATLWANLFFGLQIFALIIYSAPPFRLKNRHIWGALTDAFYGHVNPILITLLAFGFNLNEGVQEKTTLFIPLVVLCTFLKGFRNILLHQVEDRRNDRKAGINTFVVKHGALFSLNLVNKLLPWEVLATVAVVLNISIAAPPFFVSALLFIVITYLKFSGWKLSYLPQRQLRFKFLYFMNDYFEGWMPVWLLLILAVHSHIFIMALVAHLLLFPSFLVKLWKDLKTIRENFKTEEDY
ncbi:MAG: UbiA family prenyltransferase [Chitinophagales bacterium]